MLMQTNYPPMFRRASWPTNIVVKKCLFSGKPEMCLYHIPSQTTLEIMQLRDGDDTEIDEWEIYNAASIKLVPFMSTDPGALIALGDPRSQYVASLQTLASDRMALSRRSHCRQRRRRFLWRGTTP